MSKKVPQKEKKLDKISQDSNAANEEQNSPPTTNRLCLSSIMPKAPQKSSKISVVSEDNLERKEKKIKELQQAIMDKKERNDAMHEAFVHRQQNTNMFDQAENAQNKLVFIAKACGLVCSTHLALKKTILKMLLSCLKQARQKKIKGAKIVLIWLIGLLSRMFGLLGTCLNQ